MTPRHVRALRGAAAAWIATIIAATSHTLAGGGAPSPVLVGVLGILASPAAIALIGRRLSAWRVGAAVVASQALFHVAFAMTAGVDPAGLRGHVHDLRLDGGAPSGGLLPDGAMLAGHLVAAAATLLVLYFGERMLRALGRGIRSVLRRADAPVVIAGVRARAAFSGGVLHHAVGIVLSDVSRRGPPSSVFAAL
ncbi:hypothetical protein [Microbacterium flavescens]|uniref:hypothetical protein n=1 Tax=Microbacterium flavescens TaxID=69366 RepID=UPI001BDE6D02|nr:hypothetical protein [Microbacterium flavescens]BFF10856.1 hypothetical protein GCM10025699_21590 [Microbacterium flavescens]